MEFNGTVLITDPKNVTTVGGSKINSIIEKAGSGVNVWRIFESNYPGIDYSKISKELDYIDDAITDWISGGDLGLDELDIELKYGWTEYSKFRIDSGKFGIYLEKDITKILDDTCITKIPNFKGDIRVYRDSRDIFHIIGVGTINFHSRW